ncbi:unnamed protein product [Dibothriocephalus latus]|uniref:Tetraspanin n=1 Tax=Dibothriocephalus latus TaxID=60516 RepID=A0A3P7M533_DIBLA|nr:unnamed protein product [Dibothriocephalus latus]
MGCEIATLLKCVITTINVILGIAFLVVAVLGLLLKTSAGFVKSLLRTSFSFGGDLTDKQAKYLTEFVLEHATSLSIIFIVVGLVLAALCFFGAFAACCVCGLLLKIYAITLGVLLVAQIIAVAVLFSNPTKVGSLSIPFDRNPIRHSLVLVANAMQFVIINPTLLSQSWNEALMQLLAYYYRGTAMEEASIEIWNFIMTFNGTCCGMNGAMDFIDLIPSTPFIR